MLSDKFLRFRWKNIAVAVFLVWLSNVAMPITAHSLSSFSVTIPAGYWSSSNPFYLGSGQTYRNWGSDLYWAHGQTWGEVQGGGGYAPVKVRAFSWQVDQSGQCQWSSSAIVSGSGFIAVSSPAKSVLLCGGQYHYYYAYSEHWVGYTGNGLYGVSTAGF